MSGNARYCEAHARAGQKKSAARRALPSASQRGYDVSWRKLRLMILAEQPLCADPFGIHADAGQVVVAEELDHIVPIQAGGRRIRSNLLPLCKACHMRKTVSDRRRRYAMRRSQVPTTVIAGPPGAGKTSFVREKACWGDLIVDLDALYCALSGLDWYDKPSTLLPFVCEARDAVLYRLGRKSEVRHAWIITSEGDRHKLARLRDTLGAEVKVMATSPTECIRRISLDDRRKDRWEHWQDLVNKWWRDWQGSSVFGAEELTEGPDVSEARG